MFIYKLTIWNVVDILAWSSINRSHCSRLAAKSSFYFACFIFILLFCRAVAIAVSPLLLFFLLLGLPYRSSLLSTIFNTSHHFYCHAIFIAAVHFIAVQPAQLLRLFIQDLTFLLLGCCFCSGPVVAIFILLLKTFLL